jgi:acetyl esterase/lipase
MRFITRFAAFASLLLSSVLLIRVKSGTGSVFVGPKMISASLTPFIAVVALLSAVVGAIYRLPLAARAGLLGAALSARYLWRVVKQTGDFAGAFGTDWEKHIPPQQAQHMLKSHWTWAVPDSPEPRWERNIPFWTIPGTDRQLLCDVWQPPAGVQTSGLAFVYFHGSGWHLLDKDFGTRPLFRHLAAQGHIIMDVAYRLCPETELTGMVGDVRRAVAWMKANAVKYGVNPHRVVIGGGSAGGHLALLAAYTDMHPQLTPDDVKAVDTSVSGVISWYGPTDMRAYYEHGGEMSGFEEQPQETMLTSLTNKMTEALFQGIRAKNPTANVEIPSLSHVGMMRNLLGGKLDEVPQVYELASPAYHVGPHCPPTLMLYGEHDTIVPVEAARTMYHKLREVGVPAVYVEFPQTEHAFDLVILPRHAPAAQAALYHVERFLALMASHEFEVKAASTQAAHP